jgi:hypothetical protein
MEIPATIIKNGEQVIIVQFVNKVHVRYNLGSTYASEVYAVYITEEGEFADLPIGDFKYEKK